MTLRHVSQAGSSSGTSVSNKEKFVAEESKKEKRKQRKLSKKRTREEVKDEKKKDKSKAAFSGMKEQRKELRSDSRQILTGCKEQQTNTRNPLMGSC